LCDVLEDAPRNKAEQTIPVYVADFSVLGVSQATPLSTALDFGECASDMWVMFQQHHTTLYMARLTDIVNASPEIRCLLVDHVLAHGHLSSTFYRQIHDLFTLRPPSHPACLDVLDLGQFDPYIFVLPDEVITSLATAEEKWAVIARPNQCAPLDPSAVPPQAPTTVGDLPDDNPSGTDLSTSDIQAVNAAVAQLNAERPDLVPGTNEHTSAVLEIIGTDSLIGQQLTEQIEFLSNNSESVVPMDDQPSYDLVDISGYGQIIPPIADTTEGPLTPPEALLPPPNYLPSDPAPYAWTLSAGSMAPVHYRDLLTVVVFTQALQPDLSLDSSEFAQIVSDTLPVGHPLSGDITTLQLILPQMGFNAVELTPLDIAEFLEVMESAIATHGDRWLLSSDFVDVVQAALPVGHPLVGQDGIVDGMLQVFAGMVSAEEGGTASIERDVPLTLGELADLLRAIDAVQNADTSPRPGDVAYITAIIAQLPDDHVLRDNSSAMSSVLGTSQMME
jgi:hypothetical protein